MKVLIISEYFPPKVMGGGEISSYLLAKNLAKKKIDVSVLTSCSKELKKFETKNGIKIYRRVKNGENPKKFMDNMQRILLFDRNLNKELIKLDNENDFDAIHCMNITSLSAINSKKALKKKFIAHINAPLVFCPLGSLVRNGKECKDKPSFKRCYKCFKETESVGKMGNKAYIKNPLFGYLSYSLYKKRNSLMKKFDHFAAASNAMADLLVKDGISRKKIDVVWNIIDYENFLKIKAKRRLENKTPNLVYIGAYIECQGINFLLETLKNVKLKYRANFYGSGPLKEKMTEFAAKNKIPAKINSGVPYNEVYRIYSESDIVIFPTLAPEGFGRIPVEAMAAAKPVIASNIGGVKDTVTDKKTGLLVEPGNVGQLKKAIEFLIKNPDFGDKLGKNGREDVKKRFNGKTIAEKMIKVYGKVMN